jgi:predicted homoserine dehydrogenase-like protein
MFIVDTKLKEREKNNNPIRVGITGAGFAAKSVLNLIEKHIPGMTVTVVCNRTIEHALSMYAYIGMQNVKVADSSAAIDNAVKSQGYAVTGDYKSLCQSNAVDIIVELTGSIDYAMNVLLEAFKNGKDVLSFNAELDSTLGPILSVYAKKAGVLYSGSDGDQPGVTMNLYRYVKSIGLTPLLAGNVKGLHDPYRNPATQAEFAKSWGIGADKATAFADGTKLCMEQTCVANAVGFKVAKRGMLGYEHRGGHIDEMVSMYDIDMLKSYGGIIEYALGAKPGPGVYIYATTEDPLIKRQLKYLKLGDGPMYSFYTPYHLCFSDVPNSIARVVDFRDCVFKFDDKPTVEVAAIAKKDLKKGEKLDGCGRFTVYGECENSDVVQAENLLPIGLADNVSLKKDISKDSPIGFNDIEYDPNRILFKLYKEQIDYFK